LNENPATGGYDQTARAETTSPTDHPQHRDQTDHDDQTTADHPQHRDQTETNDHDDQTTIDHPQHRDQTDHDDQTTADHPQDHENWKYSKNSKNWKYSKNSKYSKKDHPLYRGDQRIGNEANEPTSQSGRSRCFETRFGGRR